MNHGEPGTPNVEYDEELRTSTSSETTETAAGEAIDEPDRDFYKGTWFQVITLAALISLTAACIAIFFIPYPEQSSSIFSKMKQNNYLIPLYFVLVVIQFIMLGFVDTSRNVWRTIQQRIYCSDRWPWMKRHKDNLSACMMFLIVFGTCAQTIFPYFFRMGLGFESAFCLLYTWLTWRDCCLPSAEDPITQAGEAPHDTADLGARHVYSAQETYAQTPEMMR